MAVIRGASFGALRRGLYATRSMATFIVPHSAIVRTAVTVTSGTHTYQAVPASENQL